MTQRIKCAPTEGTIIQWSHVVLAEGVVPHRAVLRHDGDNYIVHTENLTVAVEGDTVTLTHESFHDGRYVRGASGEDNQKAYRLALKAFSERVGELR